MARGDHLYYFRAGGAYSHHGIDYGDGTVIHFDSSPWMKMVATVSTATTPRISRVSLEEFAQGHELLVRSYAGELQVDDEETALARAESRIGEQGYDVFGNNCEHFVVWCKTGVAESSQVNAHRRASNALIQGAPVGAFLLKVARKVPRPYRGMATVGAVAVGGAVYVGTYLQNRVKNRDAGHS